MAEPTDIHLESLESLGTNKPTDKATYFDALEAGLILRGVKGSPLTYEEMDDNLLYLELLAARQSIITTNLFTSDIVIPTSNVGLDAGTIWNDNGTLKVVI